jgi:hypothetical protein
VPDPSPKPSRKPPGIAEIKLQLEAVTARLKELESLGERCTAAGCRFISDGLRLSQEVELLRRENAALLAENSALKVALGLKSDSTTAQ